MKYLAVAIKETGSVVTWTVETNDQDNVQAWADLRRREGFVVTVYEKTGY